MIPRLPGLAGSRVLVTLPLPPGDHDVRTTTQPIPPAHLPDAHFEELLIQADRALVVASLARGMAHDLRGPLQTLTLLADPTDNLLGGPDAPRLRLALSESVQHLADAIARFSQIYAPPETEVAPVVVDELLGQVIELQRYQRGLLAVDIQLELSGGLPAVRGLEAQLKHLLLGLVSNAKLALEGRAGPILVLSAAAEGPQVRITVEDNGSGMEATSLARAVEPFYTTHPGRLGIGLTVAECLARRHGGSLTLESVPARGTRAVLRLPTWQAPVTAR